MLPLIYCTDTELPLKQGYKMVYLLGNKTENQILCVCVCVAVYVCVNLCVCGRGSQVF